MILPGGVHVACVIDGLKRRIGRQVNGTLVQRSLYDSLLHPVAELDGSGNVISRFVCGARCNSPDYLVQGGTRYRIITDHLGSPRRVVDVTTGVVAQEIIHDSFGKILPDSNPGFQPFGFAGGLCDRDTKLTRSGKRGYDAETGRWTTKAPILFAGRGANRWGYVFHGPVNLLDPRGAGGCGRRSTRPGSGACCR